MLDYKKYSDRHISIQARFLIAPFVGVLLILVLYLNTSRTIEESTELIIEINESHLARIGELNQLQVYVLAINSRLFTLLNDPNSQGPEYIYLTGKTYVDVLYKIQEQLNKNLADKGDLVIDGENINDEVRRLYSAYLRQVIRAIEMAPIDVHQSSFELAIAQEKLLPLNKLFLKITNYHHSQLTGQSDLVERALFEETYITHITGSMLALMILIAFYFTKKTAIKFDEMEVKHGSLAKELIQFIGTANAPIFGVNSKGEINEWNHELERITGYSKVDVMGRNFVDNYIVNDDKAAVDDVLQKTLAGEEAAYFSFSLSTQSGEKIDVRFNSTTRRNGNDEIIGMIGVGQDITELNKANEEQERIAKELMLFVDTANAPIFGIDNEGKINEWNQRAEKITGITKTEMMGLDLRAVEFITDDNKALLGKVLEKALQGEETTNFEFPLISRSGDQVEVRLNLTTRRDVNRNIIGVVGVGLDITELNKMRMEQESERKEAAAQIIQASKLATLGEMATSVAHELNQPLNNIRMAAGNSRRKIANGTAEPEYLSSKLERIEEQTARAAAIIDHMRMFGRKAEESPESVDPRKVVTNALDLMGEQLKLAGIVVVTEFAEDCSFILGHIIQLEQVILNLLTNARDAIAERDGKAKITLRVFSDAESVHITSEDTGGGIPEDVLPRIFEPFYTTKEMGKGTGLGLSVGYGIIRDMSGTIAAENIDDGARFTITLPSVS